MKVYLDSNCIIYLVEGNPVWAPIMIARIAELRSIGSEIVVSDLARTECLAGPLGKGLVDIVSDYQTFFSHPAVLVTPLNAAACERAAHIRASSHFRLKVPDCLHLAAAIESGCTLFLTNDAQLSTATEILVEVLV